jgi:hypothetical protein
LERQAPNINKYHGKQLEVTLHITFTLNKILSKKKQVNYHPRCHKQRNMIRVAQ